MGLLNLKGEMRRSERSQKVSRVEGFTCRDDATRPGHSVDHALCGFHYNRCGDRVISRPRATARRSASPFRAITSIRKI